MMIHFLHNPVSARRFAAPLVEFLRREGVEAELWAEPKGGTPAFLEKTGLPIRYAWFDLSLNLVKTCFRILNLWRELSGIRPAVIHTHQTRGAFIPLLAGFVAGTKTRIYHNHGTPYSGYSGVFRLVLWVLEYLNCSLATHIFSVRGSLRDEMVRSGLCPVNKVSVIGNGSACGIDLEEFPAEIVGSSGKAKSRAALDIQGNAFVVLYVGRPHKRKGFDILLESWVSGHSQCSNDVLLVAGCSERDVLQRVGYMPSGIRAVGYVTDIVPLYAACDVVVLPSRHEGFPYALLEGAAAGRALIGTANTGAEAIIEPRENGLLIEGGDSNGLLAALSSMKENVELRESMGRNGRKLVENRFDRRDFLLEFRKSYAGLGLLGT